MKDPLIESIAQNLRRLRTESGMTQQEVADHLRLDRSAYARYETGATAPSCSVLQAAAREFGTTVDALLRPAASAPARFTLRQSDLPILHETDSLSLLGECDKEERAFLSMLRHMTPEGRQKALRACLDILESEK